MDHKASLPADPTRRRLLATTAGSLAVAGLAPALSAAQTATGTPAATTPAGTAATPAPAAAPAAAPAVGVAAWPELVAW